jgi:hypothetical protein
MIRRRDRVLSIGPMDVNTRDRGSMESKMGWEPTLPQAEKQKWVNGKMASV